MTQPSATTASQRPLAASLRATTGSSTAPGTLAMRRSSVAPSRSSQEAEAPFRRLDTIKSLNRAATLATLRPRAVTSPSTMGASAMSAVIHQVSNDYQEKRQDAM